MGRGERSITLEGKWTPTPTPTEIISGNHADAHIYGNQLRESTPKPTLTTPTPTPTLTPKLYMLGLAFGPLNMAPLSELIGRRWLYLVTSFNMIAFAEIFWFLDPVLPSRSLAYHQRAQKLLMNEFKLTMALA
ncbi:uncharacterized protein PV07_08661 [Cladophialophora immunda]|uniref:Major facilitator superfamily (MFS) profile domain-containing protein n=1 Tax=Cladophialophora immunda TaxID=569365 RepID=A0A0D2C4Y0_9EURO|nr:uncharacterized protein PV07_08661 [Cladophialophora immunda]KIW25495.1 hypothetical protein PV07_08661 [Cladophialophora immunda]